MKLLTEYEYEYIRRWFFHRIRILNIFITRQLTECKYQIYSFLSTWSNVNFEYIFIFSNLAKYEYQIHSKQENWLFKFEYVIFGAYWIFKYICVTLGWTPNFSQVCFIFMQTRRVATWPNTNIEYIRSSQPDQIRILNIFVVPNLTKYEYRIYSVLANWPNTNIEYIHNQKIEYSYSNI